MSVTADDSSVPMDSSPPARTTVRHNGHHATYTLSQTRLGDSFVLPFLDSAVLNPRASEGSLRRETLVRKATKTMAGEQSLHLNVSEAYFRLVTESIRLFSNKHLRCSSISDVVNGRADSASGLPSNYQPKSLQEHLRIIPTDGEVGVKLEILETSATAISGSIPDLEKLIGSSISFASALSLVLFDFVVEENRTEIINKLGLNIDDAAAFKAAAKRTETNVVPFR